MDIGLSGLVVGLLEAMQKYQTLAVHCGSSLPFTLLRSVCSVCSMCMHLCMHVYHENVSHANASDLCGLFVTVVIVVVLTLQSQSNP